MNAILGVPLLFAVAPRVWSSVPAAAQSFPLRVNNGQPDKQGHGLPRYMSHKTVNHNEMIAGDIAGVSSVGDTV